MTALEPSTDQPDTGSASERDDLEAQSTTGTDTQIKTEVTESNEDREDKDQSISASIKPLIICIVLLGINLGVGFATNTYWECVVSFGINIASFLCIAWPFHTEKYYDFTGMITFLSVDVFSIAFNRVPWNMDYVRNIVLFFMVMAWTLRLGIFLFQRISAKHGGKDKRFDNLRNNFSRFLVAWCLQATWAYFCCMPLFIANQFSNGDVFKSGVSSVTVLDIIGWCLWAFGWGFEIVADRQKTVFKNDPTNRGKFCNVGLWSVSRHPNYFGEITLWIGIFVSAASVARNAGWLIVLSPIWTILLLVFSSGIPLAERTSMKKYGEQSEYQEYVQNVSVLIPLPCCWKGYI